MSVAELLSKPEFWSALFGALAAFLLGALATWWASLNAKRTAGNMAIIALSQMCSLMENVRHELIVSEPLRIQGILKRAPFPFEIRPAIGLPDSPPRIAAEGLGFLADSYDPDILNRLLTVERAFATMLDLVRRHETVHAKITETMSALDPAGRQRFETQGILQAIGVKLLVEVDGLIEGLEKGLPETRDMLIEMAKQLHGVLRVQIPFRRFIRFSAVRRTRLADQPQNLPKPAIWRRLTRWTFDLLLKRRSLHQHRDEPPAVAQEPEPPAIQRFPPRSWETNG